MHPLQINPPPPLPLRPVGGEMTSLLRTFATSCYQALHPGSPAPSRRPFWFYPRGSCSLRHAQIQISRRPHILKMSAPIYGSDEAERFRLPRIQIVLFFDGFSSPENRVARYSFLEEQTNIVARRNESDVVALGDFISKRSRKIQLKSDLL